jgi:hypothetical protein
VPRTQVALAGRVKPGDAVVIDGRTVVISRVKRAQGRKPAAGENLHLVAEDGELLRVNSLTAVRISARPTS